MDGLVRGRTPETCPSADSCPKVTRFGLIRIHCRSVSRDRQRSLAAKRRRQRLLQAERCVRAALPQLKAQLIASGFRGRNLDRKQREARVRVLPAGSDLAADAPRPAPLRPAVMARLDRNAADIGRRRRPPLDGLSRSNPAAKECGNCSGSETATPEQAREALSDPHSI